VPVVERQSKDVKQRYRWAIKVFRAVAGVKDEYTDDDIRRAIEKLECRYKPSSVNSIFKVCRTYIPGWPKDLSYKFSSADVTKVIAGIGDIAKMIYAVKGDGDAMYRGYMLLSTLYGLRCSELAAVKPEDIRLDQNIFFARTLKGGVQREHLIPESVKHHFSGLSIFPQSRQLLTAIYKMIEAKAGIEHRQGAGWHAIRHALATGLAENGADPTMAKNFLRWKDTGMYENYIMFTYRTDRVIFDIHPFLSLWEDK